MYLPNNPVYHRAREALGAAFGPVWKATDEIVLTVAETDLVWEDTVVYSQLSKPESFAWSLYKDGMRVLTLRRGVEASTGIIDLVILSVLRIQNFAPGAVHERAQYGVFFLCTTETSNVRLRDDQFRWVSRHDELAGLALFNPLVEDLVTQALASQQPG